MSYPPKGKADFWQPGDHNAVCFYCGKKFKASMLRKNWQGVFVCDRDWEPRQAQDFVRGVPDNPAPAWVQPMPTDDFVEFCTANGASAIPGFAMPGCMIPGYLSPSFNSEGDPF